MSDLRFTRREFLGGSLAVTLLADAKSPSLSGSESGRYRLFWGDLHNHNEVGYGKGSLSE